VFRAAAAIYLRIMDEMKALRAARAAITRRSWGEACDAYAHAARTAELAVEDLERLADAAYMAGRDAESEAARARAHRQRLEAGEVEAAVRCAFWLAFCLLQKGEPARGGGWLARAHRLLEDGPRECVEQGYLLLPQGMQAIARGDAGAAHEAFRAASELASRHGEADLLALALHCRGRVRIRQGAVAEGVALLDEAMAAVEAGTVSAIVAGDVYCSVIEGCIEIFDIGRAREWTAALERWCDSQEELVPYRGQCLVRRAEILQHHGEWGEALEEARRACDWLSRPPGEPAAGAAFYRQAELHRLRGELAEAESAYARAGRLGRLPQPGLALLRLAQGRRRAAAATIREAVAGAGEPHAQARLLPAQVEIMLATGDVAAARAAADALGAIATEREAPMLRALADQARGAVLLAAGDARGALVALRSALSGWQAVEAPYEAARTRLLMAAASHSLGDGAATAVELEAARRAFDRLGAVPELARLQPPARGRGPLTRRELEVLRQVAAGASNRSIAGALFISEKTVARHISNIFRKIGVGSRSAATAWAYEQGVVAPDAAPPGPPPG
jgi:DNA-binding NarL/FixJ family response regulator